MPWPPVCPSTCVSTHVHTRMCESRLALASLSLLPAWHIRSALGTPQRLLLRLECKPGSGADSWHGGHPQEFHPAACCSWYIPCHLRRLPFPLSHLLILTCSILCSRYLSHPVPCSLGLSLGSEGLSQQRQEGAVGCPQETPWYPSLGGGVLGIVSLIVSR